MKAYGVKRILAPGRNRPGTSRPCPCCSHRAGGKAFKQHQRSVARREGKEEVRSALKEAAAPE